MIRLFSTDIEFDTFPNGEIGLNKTRVDMAVSNNLESYFTGTDVMTIGFKYEDNSDFFKLSLLKDYLDRWYGEYRMVLDVMYMPYSRMDRDNDTYSFSLKVAAGVINSLGFDSVLVQEPHSDVTMALLNNSEKSDLTMKLFNRFVRKNPDIRFIPAFPDASAQKRYEFAIGGSGYCFANKTRDFKTGRIISYDMFECGVIAHNVTDIVIIDDLCSKGGTFWFAAQKLEILYPDAKLHLIVAHCENTINEGRLPEDSRFKSIYTSNSILTEINEPLSKKIDVYNIW